MKKFLLFLGALLLGSSVCVAQTTAVTATVVDSDSTVWVAAPYSWSFQPGPAQSNPALYTYNGAPLASFSGSGAADGSGNISISSAIYDVTLIRPVGASYNLTVCPNASTKCSTINFSPSTGSMDVSAAVNAAIVAPRFKAVSGAYGYNDGEAILQLQPGSTYWNTTSSVSRCYTGSGWGVCSTGGSGSGTVSDGPGTTTPVQTAISTSVAHAISYMPSYAVSVTAPPYNAVCDGIVDDHVAIQACLDNEAACFIPRLANGHTVCNVGTVGLTLCSGANSFQYNGFYGNGQFLTYSGTGAMITLPSCATETVADLNMDGTGSTGTPTVLEITGDTITVTNVQDDEFPAGFASVDINGGYNLAINNYLGTGLLKAEGGASTNINGGLFSGFTIDSNGGTFINGTGFYDPAVLDTLSNSAAFQQAYTAFSAVTFPPTGSLLIDGSAHPVSASFAGTQIPSTVTASGTPTINGDANLQIAGPPSITGGFTGTLNVADLNGVSYRYINGLLAGTFEYTHAGTELGACGAGNLFSVVAVGDASVLTPGTTYVPSAGAGTDRINVQCTYTGSVYAWQTM